MIDVMSNEDVLFVGQDHHRQGCGSGVGERRDVEP